MASDILIVDDETDIRELISGILNDEGYDTRNAGDSDRALAAIEARRPGLVVLDIWLQGSRLDGLELLDVIRERHPDLPVIIISGHGNIETAVSAIKQGAYDFIEKPFKADRLILVVQRAIEAFRLRRENSELRVRVGDDTSLIGASPAIAQVRQTVDKVAPRTWRPNAWRLNSSEPRKVRRARARSAYSSRHMAARSSSRKCRKCRLRRRAKFFASWSTRPSNG
jgi:two-component system nitrogen regulation response regulator NtrX